MAKAFSDYMGAGSKPKLITPLTSGTGTYIPTADMARCFVRIQAAGNDGSSIQAGVAGAMVENMLRVPIAGVAYMVGASGAQGSASSFGSLRAQPGFGMVGGLLGNGTTNTVLVNYGGMVGVSGGGVSPNASAARGAAPGFSAGGVDCAKNGANVGSGSYGSGGDSFYGAGGVGVGSGVGGNATGYGAGGGAGPSGGGKGTGGYIEIWDYGV